MNKRAPTPANPAPFLAVYATGKPPQARKHPLQPEKPSLVLGPFRPWTSCLTSRPDGLERPSDLLRPADDRKPPIYRTASMLMGTWDPARHTRIAVRRKHPIQPEAPTPAATKVTRAAEPAPREKSGQHPMRPEGATPEGATPEGTTPEETLATSPLRNGNRQGNPNAAPRCGARTRLGCPCRGPAMKNGKCRMHGGASTGAKTLEGRARIAAARTTHGGYGAEQRAFQARIAAMARRGRVLCAVATASLPFEAVAPLIHQVQDVSKRNTPYAQETANAMRALVTIDLSAKQATTLTRLIRATGQPSRHAGKHPMQPESAQPIPTRHR
jgi:hypothetical protein